MARLFRSRRCWSTAVACVSLAACTVGPGYVRPQAEPPAAFKEAAGFEGWKTAQPRDQIPRGRWWEVFNDADLNALAQQVDSGNFSLRAAEARVRQARTLTQQARAAWFPTLTGSAAATRSDAGSRGTTTTARGAANSFNLGLDANWEIDLWGRVRRTVEAGVATEQASAADLEAARLSLQAQLASDYFLLRVQDAQIQLLNDSAAAFDRSLKLTRNQYNVGVAARADVVQAEAQLKSTQAQAVDAGVARSQLEHAVAVLIGKAPAEVSIPVVALSTSFPAIPAMLPSELLERRPDIAGAERRMAAANARIGVAEASFFPTLGLSASGGFQSSVVSQLLSLPSRYWSIGPALVQTLFDAGLRRAQTAQAIAAYDEAEATYRQTVLGGFQEVEDNLAALRILAQEASIQDEAVRAARESLAITNNQYKAGIVNYLSVVIVQTAALNNERTALGILGRRLDASVTLIKALGGGWDAGELRAASR